MSSSPSPAPSEPISTSDPSDADKRPSPITSTSDLVEFANAQLSLLERNFSEKSSLILQKIEHMGNKLTDLEQSIHELMDQSALPSSNSDLPSSAPSGSTENEIQE